MTHDDTMLEYVAQNMLEYVESLPLLVFVLGTFGSDSFKIRPVIDATRTGPNIRIVVFYWWLTRTLNRDWLTCDDLGDRQ